VRLRNLNIDDGMAVVRRWHRHLDAPQGAKFAIGAFVDDELVGVALVGRPIARQADNGDTAEVIRVATNGYPNACSWLYSRAKRAAHALGFTKVITKTRPDESGASLRAVGAELLGTTRAQQWDRENRRRKEVDASSKLRWEL
jgi:hypothetical protein